MSGAFTAVLRRDLTLALRCPGEIITTLAFFVIVVSLFPLGVGVDRALLLQLGPGVVWVAALLASMLGLERLFAADLEDGALEQMLLAPQSLAWMVLAKIGAHWLLTGLPLVIIAPLMALQYQLSGDALWVMGLSLLLGAPVLSLIGAIGAALTVGLRGGGVLLSLLVLPLYIPVLVYGAGAVRAAGRALADTVPYFQLLAAFLLIALLFAPLATAAALRISME